MRQSKNARKKLDALQAVNVALAAGAVNSGSGDGEEYICRNCDVPEKPCVENPLYECAEKLLGGTQFESARNRSRMFMNGESPRCALCGTILSARQLQRAPLSELCPACRGKVKSPAGS